ncbi:MAG: hypothetical protein KDA96_14905, partial [Planctomycetaceae bacterium]|nr:hypothetical protein [Planctomycetaceae bacterium]
PLPSDPARIGPAEGGTAAQGTEVTIIISGPGGTGQKRVIVIPEATPFLLELLTGEKSALDPVIAGAN